MYTNGILLISTEKLNQEICMFVDRMRNDNIEWSNPGIERLMFHDISHLRFLAPKCSDYNI